MSASVKYGGGNIVGPYIVVRIPHTMAIALGADKASYDSGGIVMYDSLLATSWCLDLGKLIQLALREAGTADVMLFMHELGAVLERLAPEASDHLKGYRRETHEEAMKTTPTGKQA